MSANQKASTERAHANGHLYENGSITRSPVIVVGMHRSGTSFVASLLHAAGLDVGARLMPAAASNERGHFENMDFVEFHMRELRLIGHDDSGWTALRSLVLPEEAATEARDIIAANASESAWGWKDPRTTLFLDFWSSVVPDANFLYVYREPSEVIESLYRRGDEAISLSPELAARAYVTHNEMMLRHAREHRAKSLIANVSAIAFDPQGFLSRLSEKFGIQLNVQTPSTFEGELMHARTESPHATLLGDIVPEIAELYATLELEADLPSPDGGKNRPSSRKVRDAFFGSWLSDSRHEAELSKQVAALRATADTLAEVEASNEQRGAYLAEAECLLEVERGLREERDRNIAELEQRLERTAREHAAQTEALIAATRAESDRVAYLLATVQSSSFWKLKRGINRILRYAGLR